VAGQQILRFDPGEAALEELPASDHNGWLMNGSINTPDATYGTGHHLQTMADLARLFRYRG
jgi:hypothetical protein